MGACWCPPPPQANFWHRAPHPSGPMQSCAGEHIPWDRDKDPKSGLAECSPAPLPVTVVQAHSGLSLLLNRSQPEQAGGRSEERRGGKEWRDIGVTAGGAGEEKKKNIKKRYH